MPRRSVCRLELPSRSRRREGKGKGTGSVTRPWDLQFKAQSDRLISLERSHAKAQTVVAKCSLVAQGLMDKLTSARKELVTA